MWYVTTAGLIQVERLRFATLPCVGDKVFSSVASMGAAVANGVKGSLIPAGGQPGQPAASADGSAAAAVTQATAAVKPPEPDAAQGSGPEQATAAADAVQPSKHVVKAGDTLWGIGQLHNVSWKQIYEQNRDVIGDNPDLIHPGQELLLPQIAHAGAAGAPPEQNETDTVQESAWADPTQVAPPPPADPMQEAPPPEPDPTQVAPPPEPDPTQVAPPPPADPTQVATGEQSRYVIQRGDTLSGIGQRFGVDWRAIHEANSDVLPANPNLIHAGVEITIPAPGTAPSANYEPVAQSVRAMALHSTPAKNTTSMPDWLRATVLSAAVDSGLPPEWADSEALASILFKESSFSPTAHNSSSGAHGLYQFMPQTWNSYGGEQTDDSYLQSVYGLRYIVARYGSPEAAWQFWIAHGWY